ncbi:substrate-binding domain-containing protein [Salipiger mangrovisoli]|uniref:Substrate-binding domain-containing protein n=1 Tax=Salipiger mangrovisoli TaxID=2865933 RepID=A0ABR9WVJ2_9RHOB|nr:substrate-binding domain-containing protein [Salipiger mangrovisoli]MBE9635303.1 substrate-binding domain-containing protein [Salipiger mangrovisoli]
MRHRAVALRGFAPPDHAHGRIPSGNRASAPLLPALRRAALRVLLLALALGGAQARAEGRISIIVNDPQNPYWAAEGAVAKATANDLGYKAVVAAHEGNTLIEGAQVDGAIAAGVDAIILDPADATASAEAVRRAKSAGIPVFVVNAGLAQPGLAVAQLLSNNAQGAELGARHWQAAMAANGTYVELLGAASDPNAAIRSKGYANVLDPVEGLQRVALAAADWDRTRGYEQTLALLDTHPEITGLIAGNDEMALGAVAALKQTGRLGAVTVGGFDGSPDAVTAVLAGELAYTVLQPVAVFAAEAVRQADHYIRTGSPRERREVQFFDCLLIDASAAARMTSPFVLPD